MSDARSEWQAAHLEAAFEKYPDPRSLHLRMDRLARAYPPALSLLLEGTDEERQFMVALLTLGDAPVEEVIRHPHLLRSLMDRRNIIEPFAENPPPLPNLARWKRHIWLKILLRERVGLAGFEETADAFSRLADETSALAMAATSPGNSPLVLFAMGKWGGRELNASSDIDPVFFAPTDCGSEEADRIIRSWTAMISGAETGDEIYPVDLRLRPEGASGPLACNLGEAERYFFQRAASWERIAYLRARHLLGPLPEWFPELLREFLYGRQHDPRIRVREVAQALRNIHASARPRDLKRSPGGIRDVEFLVASYQLTEGHDNPEMREGTILQLLHVLTAQGMISEDQETILREGYILLRSAEHALQAEEDRPHFILPEPGSPLANRLSWAVGLTPDSLESVVQSRMKAIEGIVNELLLSEAPEMVPGAPVVDPQADPVQGNGDIDNKLNAQIAPILRRLSGPWGQPSTLFDSRQLPEAHDPQELLLRLESAVNSYGGGRSWKQAFGHQPKLLERLTKLLRFGRRLLDEANARPYLWEKIGSRESLPFPDKSDEQTLAAWLGNQLFLLGDRFIAGELTVAALTSEWTSSIDRMITSLATPVLTPHRPSMSLLAMGKWGGCELAPDADLDLMFVCEDADGEALAIAIRTAMNWMQTASLSGRLQLDARLRPEGGPSPMVITLSRLEEYLTTRAQPWERMALTRARPVAGNSDIGTQALEILQNFTTSQPAEDEWRKMDQARRKAAELARPRPGILRLKKAIGGMMDFEFAASFAGWRHQVPRGEWWYQSIADRLTSLADITGTSLFKDAADAYLELRHWDMVQLLSSGHRRGDIHTRDEEADRFAKAVGLTPEEIEKRWKEIAALGRKVYEVGLNG